MGQGGLGTRWDAVKQLVGDVWTQNGQIVGYGADADIDQSGGTVEIYCAADARTRVPEFPKGSNYRGRQLV
ncbi:MAG: hypothetical protein M3360_01105 [Actinomycetota bacterium]|nr:hypothetical protein [Actinomycetota bacterium]